MNKAQRKAIYDYCDFYGYDLSEVLIVLKRNGTVRRDATLADLSDYTDKPTYDAMFKFLEENVL